MSLASSRFDQKILSTAVQKKLEVISKMSS